MYVEGTSVLLMKEIFYGRISGAPETVSARLFSTWIYVEDYCS